MCGFNRDKLNTKQNRRGGREGRARSFKGGHNKEQTNRRRKTGERGREACVHSPPQPHANWNYFQHLQSSAFPPSSPTPSPSSSFFPHSFVCVVNIFNPFRCNPFIFFFYIKVLILYSPPWSWEKRISVLLYRMSWENVRTIIWGIVVRFSSATRFKRERNETGIKKNNGE